MTDPKKLLDDALKVAKTSAEELVDRGKAVASDIASRIGSNEAENAQDRADAAAARARADASKKEYEADLTRMDGQLNDALGQAKAQAGELVDRAKAEAGKAAQQTRDAANQAADKARDIASRVDASRVDASQVGAAPPQKPTTAQSTQTPEAQAKAQEQVDAGLYDK